jgi:hypothetical protein
MIRTLIKKDEVILLNTVFCPKPFKIKAYLSPSLQSVTFLLKQGTSYSLKGYSGVPPPSERKREKTSKSRFELWPLASLLHGFLIFLIYLRHFRFASLFWFILISHIPSCQYYLLRSSLLCDTLSFSGTTKVAAMTIFLFQVPISLFFLSNVQ